MSEKDRKKYTNDSAKKIMFKSEISKSFENRARSRMNRKSFVSTHDTYVFKASELETQIREIETIRSQYKEQCKFATENISSDLTDQHQKLEGLLSCVEVHLELKTSYYRLGALVAFALIYVTTLFLQRDVSASFAVESRCIWFSKVGYWSISV